VQSSSYLHHSSHPGPEVVCSIAIYTFMSLMRCRLYVAVYTDSIMELSIWGIMEGDGEEPGGVTWCQSGYPCEKTVFQMRPFSSCDRGWKRYPFQDLTAQNVPLFTWFWSNFSEMYPFEDYFWKKHPLFAIFGRIPYPKRVTRVTRSLFKNRPLYSILFTHMRTHPGGFTRGQSGYPC
jgi:hypothetical protein